MFRWIIQGKLIAAHRPRATGQRLGQVPKSSVNEWIRLATRGLGARSIVCLLDKRELRRYGSLPQDLLSYYRARKLRVVHIPSPNHKRPRLTEVDLKKVWRAYQRLPKPVLIHCSAGISRTGAAVRYIKLREKPSGIAS